MTLEEMRKRMNEYYSRFSPESFCEMLEKKYCLKEISISEEGLISEIADDSRHFYCGENFLFSLNDSYYGDVA